MAPTEPTKACGEGGGPVVDLQTHVTRNPGPKQLRTSENGSARETVSYTPFEKLVM
jgi:hypothetical protein